MSDNELDNLFKEAADGFKAPKDQSAWEAMSKRLDDAGVGTSGFWNWKTLSTVGIVGITGIASILYFTKTDVKPTDAIAIAPSIEKEVIETKPNGSATSEAVAESNSSPSAQKALSSVSEEKNRKETENERVKAESKLAVDESNRNEASAPKEELNNLQQASIASRFNKESKLNQPQASPEPTPLDAKRITLNDLEKSTIISSETKPTDSKISSTEEKKDSKQSEDLKQPVVDENVAIIDKQQEKKPVVENRAENSVTENASPRTNNPSDILAPVDSAEAVKENESVAKSTESPVSEKKPKDDKVKSGRGLSIKVAVAPDYSSVGNSSPSGLGYGYGLLFEYKLSNHWSVATGGIWERKIYSANDVEYNGYTADKVDGNCHVWDIPINVYYSFAPTRRLSFYTGLGFSSYIMNKENYVLYYDGPYGKYDYPLEVKGKNNEWFKVLNVSMGLQMRLNNVISLQVEPTLKAPLAGVGEGEVSLVSLGAFFNVRFDIPIRK